MLRKLNFAKKNTNIIIYIKHIHKKNNECHEILCNGAPRYVVMRPLKLVCALSHLGIWTFSSSVSLEYRGTNRTVDQTKLLPIIEVAPIRGAKEYIKSSNTIAFAHNKSI